MKILIVGSGGVGGYFGGKLAQAGFNVTFIARGKHLEAIQSKGLTIKSTLGDFSLNSVKVTHSLQKIRTADIVILALKTWQVKEIAPELAKTLHSNSIVLPLQNGVLATSELQKYIDPKLILGGVCKIFSKIESFGVINHFGAKPTLIFGEMSQTITPRAKQLQLMFEQANIYSILSDNIQGELWKKFILICSSGLLAVSKTTYGEIRERKEMRQMLIDLFQEVHLLSQKENVDVPTDYVTTLMKIVDSYPHTTTNSLTRDIWQNKPSEIEHQNGTVVQLAKKHGIDLPINQFVYYSILPMESKARKNLNL